MPEPTPAAKPRAAAKTEKSPEQIAEEAQAADLQAALDAHRSLTEALAWVAGAITEVPKNGRNNHFGYTYATKDDMIAVLKPLLAQAGLIVIPRHVSTERSEPDAKGFVDLVVSWDMVIVHGPTGSSMSVPWSSEAMDNQDKGFGKAATSAMKMFYQALFDIPSGDVDIEHDSNSTKDREGGERAASPRSSGSKQVYTKTLIAYKTDNNLTKAQVDWALKQVGVAAGAMFKDVPDESKGMLLSKMEEVVAERAKRDPDTGEPVATPPPDADTTLPLEDDGGAAGGVDPLYTDDDDVPFKFRDSFGVDSTLGHRNH